MLKSQKAQIAAQHILAVVALLLLPMAFQFGIDTIETKLSTWETLGAALLPAVGLLFSQIFDRNLKFQLVYLKRTQAAAGYRVQALCKRDERYLYSDLQERWPSVFGDDVDSSELNARWYTEIYRSVREMTAVATANKRFMLARDVYCSSLFIVLVMGLWLIGQYSFLPDLLSPITALILLVEVIVVRYIALSCGEDLVTTSVSEALHFKEAA